MGARDIGTGIASVFTTPRRLSLVLILLAGTWALWPPAKQPGKGETPDDSAKTLPQVPPGDRKYTLTIAPGAFYMPGTMPGNVGKPLEGLNSVARRFEDASPDTTIALRQRPHRPSRVAGHPALAPASRPTS